MVVWAIVNGVTDHLFIAIDTVRTHIRNLYENVFYL